MGITNHRESTIHNTAKHSHQGQCVLLRRHAASAGAAEFQFARRADGSVKDINGVLGGLRIVAGDRNEQELMRTIKKVCLVIMVCEMHHNRLAQD
jgi:hypothetical protein